LLLGGLALGCGGAGDGAADFGSEGAGGSSDSGETSSGDTSGTSTGSSTGSSGSSSGGGAEGTVNSVKAYGDPLGQTASAVAHFANGDIAVIGSFYGSVDFGGGTAATSNGEQDIFVARYTPEGTNLWIRTLGGSPSSAQDHGYDVAVDPAGDVVIVGYVASDQGYGWGSLHYQGPGGVVAKLDGNSGAPMWGSLLGTYGDGIQSVATDAQGNILLARDYVSYNGDTHGVAGLMKLSPDGEELWERRSWGCDKPSTSLAVAAYGSHVYLTGHFEGTCSFGGAPLVSAGGRDVFLAKYDKNGDHIGSMAFGGAGNDEGLDIAVSELSGDVVLTGAFEGAVDFGGGLLESAGMTDGFVLKLSADSTHLWSQRFGGPVDDAGLGIATDGHERVYVSGYYQQVIDLGMGPLSSEGVGDVLVAKLDPTGEALWTHSFGGSAWDEGASLSVAPQSSTTAGAITVVGDFQASAAFGSTELNSAGSADAFVLQLAP